MSAPKFTPAEEIALKIFPYDPYHSKVVAAIEAERVVVRDLYAALEEIHARLAGAHYVTIRANGQDLSGDWIKPLAMAALAKARGETNG